MRGEQCARACTCAMCDQQAGRADCGLVVRRIVGSCRDRARSAGAYAGVGATQPRCPACVTYACGSCGVPSPCTTSRGAPLRSRLRTTTPVAPARAARAQPWPAAAQPIDVHRAAATARAPAHRLTRQPRPWRAAGNPTACGGRVERCRAGYSPTSRSDMAAVWLGSCRSTMSGCSCGRVGRACTVLCVPGPRTPPRGGSARDRCPYRPQAMSISAVSPAPDAADWWRTQRRSTPLIPTRRCPRRSLPRPRFSCRFGAVNGQRAAARARRRHPRAARPGSAARRRGGSASAQRAPCS